MNKKYISIRLFFLVAMCVMLTICFTGCSNAVEKEYSDEEKHSSGYQAVDKEYSDEEKQSSGYQAVDKEYSDEEMYMRFSPDYRSGNIIADEDEIEAFLTDLKSDDFKTVYFAISKLAESYNYGDLRDKTIKELAPFLESSNTKLKESAKLTTSILSDNMDYPHIIELSDGSYIFTIMNGFSDYGTYNKIYRIKDSVLEIYVSFDSPQDFIYSIYLSPDKSKFVVLTRSNKSEYIEIFDVANGISSPELMDSARIKYAAENDIPYFQRIDYENYSAVSFMKWIDNGTLYFAADMSLDGGETIIAESVEYDCDKGVLSLTNFGNAP